MRIHCKVTSVQESSSRWSAWAIALVLLIACGGHDKRMPMPKRSRAARFSHETTAASIEASTAELPPACSAGVQLDTGSTATAASPDWTDSTFFYRVRQQLILHWNPTMLLALIDPTGRRYGAKRRSAEIRLCLSPAGELTGATVMLSSGVPELDEAMVRVFMSASPFLNPPDTLACSDGQIRFAYSFEFYTTPPGKGPVMSLYPSYRQEPRKGSSAE
jgi:outer membrane biosynthesis protein TonB